MQHLHSLNRWTGEFKIAAGSAGGGHSYSPGTPGQCRSCSPRARAGQEGVEQSQAALPCPVLSLSLSGASLAPRVTPLAPKVTPLAPGGCDPAPCPPAPAPHIAHVNKILYSRAMLQSITFPNWRNIMFQGRGKAQPAPCCWLNPALPWSLSGPLIIPSCSHSFSNNDLLEIWLEKNAF